MLTTEEIVARINVLRNSNEEDTRADEAVFELMQDALLKLTAIYTYITPPIIKIPEDK